MELMIFFISNFSWAIFNLLFLIADISSTSLIIFSKTCEAESILDRYCSIRFGSVRCFLAISVRPTIAFIGVLISWLIRARKRLLAWLASSACIRVSISCWFFSSIIWKFLIFILKMTRNIRHKINKDKMPTINTALYLYKMSLNVNW